MKRASQISESIQLGIILAFAGGFMDAYSYMCRGQVFANAQTGNMLLFGIHLCKGEGCKVMYYFFSVFSFAVGIFIADLIKSRLKENESIHWRQICVICEAVILVSVSFMPQSMNLGANCLTSLACGIQVESFRKILGIGYATTMCIGNLRSAVENMFSFLNYKDKECGKKSILYFTIILCFIAGAVLGNTCVEFFSERAIAINSIFLMTAFLVMFIDLEKVKDVDTKRIV